MKQANHLVEAAAQYEKAVERAKQSLGKDDLDTGMVLSQLGDVYLKLKRPDRAEACYLQSLAILSSRLPRADQIVTYVVNNLAMALSCQEKYDEAIRLNLENLKVRQAVLGEEHPYTLLSIHNLVGEYDDLGRFDEAISVLEPWLEKHDAAQWEKWPSFAVLLENLGLAHLRLGHFDKAEGYLTRALSISEDRHHDTPLEAISIRELLAEVYAGRKTPENLDKAKDLFQRCVKDCQERLGADHSETAKAMFMWGETYYNAGKFAEAAPILSESVRISQKAGVDDAHSTTALGLLVEAEMKLGQMAEAENHTLSALKTAEAHLVTRSSLNGLDWVAGALIVVARRSEHRERIDTALQEFVAGVEGRAGRDDPAAARAMRLAAQVYLQLGSFDQSRQLSLRALEIYRKQSAPDELETADTLDRLGWNAVKLAQYAEAEPCFQECLQLRRKKLGDEHYLVASSLCDLGFVYFRMQRYQDAETILRQALAVATKAGPKGRAPAALASGYLGRLCTERQRNDEAETLLKQSLDLERQLSGEHTSSYGWGLVYLAQHHTGVGRLDEAEAEYRQALDVFAEVYGKGDVNYPVARGGWATCSCGRANMTRPSRPCGRASVHSTSRRKPMIVIGISRPTV